MNLKPEEVFFGTRESPAYESVTKDLKKQMVHLHTCVKWVKENIILLTFDWSFSLLDFPIDLSLQKYIWWGFFPWLLPGKYHDPVSPDFLKPKPRQWLHSRDSTRESGNELPWGGRLLEDETEYQKWGPTTTLVWSSPFETAKMAFGFKVKSLIWLGFCGQFIIIRFTGDWGTNLNAKCHVRSYIFFSSNQNIFKI